MTGAVRRHWWLIIHWRQSKSWRTRSHLCARETTHFCSCPKKNCIVGYLAGPHFTSDAYSIDQEDQGRLWESRSRHGSWPLEVNSTRVAADDVTQECCATEWMAAVTVISGYFIQWFTFLLPDVGGTLFAEASVSRMRIIKVYYYNVWCQKGFITSLLKTRSEVKVSVTLCSGSVVVKCSQMFVDMEPNLGLVHWSWPVF